MRICAYDELYVVLAQRVLGDMFDYAINTLKFEASLFQKMFIASSISHQIEMGNPAYIAGMNGCELAKEVVSECGFDRFDEVDIMYVNKSAEYWIGWALAYYQWISNLKFSDIDKFAGIDELYNMYSVYHEMDIEIFVETMNEKSRAYTEVSRLKRFRKYAALSQSELARNAEVALRQIQLFEQGQRDINKTQGETLLKLSKAIGCEMKDLID